MMSAKIAKRNWCLLLLVAAVCAGCAGKPPAEDKPIIERTKLMSQTATVEAIDLNDRVITLRGESGNSAAFDVDEQVKNLAQVHVGDKVVVDYVEAIAVRILQKGTEPSMVVDESVEAAKPGGKPGGASTHRVTLVAVIEAIDVGRSMVTLRGTEGRTVDVKVSDPENLKKVKVGDSVQITYTQAMAVAVRKP
jgi:hypothetical protein